MLLPTTKAEKVSIKKDVQTILREIEDRSKNGEHIYRGEPRWYEKVSSKFYRDLVENEIATGGILWLQKEEIIRARKQTINPRNRHPGASSPVFNHLEHDELEMLMEIQHLGGSTVLIDFTTSHDVALFFACQSDDEENGRVIVIRADTEEAQEYIVRPKEPKHRVVVQQSVMWGTEDGLINEKFYNPPICVPHYLKRDILDYLETFKGISKTSLYNDMHGFVQCQQERFKRGDIGYLKTKRPLNW